MKLSELIDELENIQSLDPDSDPEVMFAYQPSWPMQEPVSTVVHTGAQELVNLMAEEIADEEGVSYIDALKRAQEEMGAMDEEEKRGEVYLANSDGGSGYLTGTARRVLGW